MRNFDQWMEEYGVSHQNPTNILIHKIFVPLIMFSVVGIIWTIPTPGSFESLPFMNWATIFGIGCLIFYMNLNFKMFIGMAISLGSMLCFAEFLERKGILLSVSMVVFALSWVAQFYGHKVEGKKPSFLDDLAFLLIGPLWVLRFVYAKMGIRV